MLLLLLLECVLTTTCGCLCCSNQAALDKARKSIVKFFTGLYRKKKLSEQDATLRLADIQYSSVESYADFGFCDLIIETIIEDAAVKQQAYAQIEAAVGKDVVIATNTSSLTLAVLSAQLKHKQRFVGLHFFNPVHSSMMVEIIRSAETSDRGTENCVKARVCCG